jgi:hypothetical protein
MDLEWTQFQTLMAPYRRRAREEQAPARVNAADWDGNYEMAAAYELMIDLLHRLKRVEALLEPPDVMPEPQSPPTPYPSPAPPKPAALLKE